MKAVSIICVVVLVVLNALALIPAAHAFLLHLSAASLAVAILLFVAILISQRRASRVTHPVSELAGPMPAPPPQAEADVVGFLAALQEKGRLVDFLMDDITAFSDAQVGAAARIVHQGCKAVLQEQFKVRPVREENEGSTVTVVPGYAADEYRFIGKIGGEAPFSGTLIHRGWKTEQVKLPRLLGPTAGQLPTIAPAEVELK